METQVKLCAGRLPYFMIGIIGSRGDCCDIKGLVKQKLAEIGLEMSDEKTKITNAASGCARFLGYDIFKFQDRRHVHLNGSIQLSVPKKKVHQLARRYMMMGRPHQRAGLVDGSVAEIVTIYDLELRGYYNHYKLAWDVGKRLAELRYIMWQSLTRTLAWKLKCHTKNINQRYKRAGPKSGINCIVVPLLTEEGTKQVTFGDFSLRVDMIPRHGSDREFFRPHLPARELTLRLKHNRCELCQEASDDLQVHHIKRLKDIRRKVKEGKATRWQEVMTARNRKTLVVCESCHNDIHRSDGVHRRAE